MGGVGVAGVAGAVGVGLLGGSEDPAWAVHLLSVMREIHIPENKMRTCSQRKRLR